MAKECYVFRADSFSKLIYQAKSTKSAAESGEKKNEKRTEKEKKGEVLLARALVLVQTLSKDGVRSSRGPSFIKTFERMREQKKSKL